MMNSIDLQVLSSWCSQLDEYELSRVPAILALLQKEHDKTAEQLRARYDKQLSKNQAMVSAATDAMAKMKIDAKQKTTVLENQLLQQNNARILALQNENNQLRADRTALQEQVAQLKNAPVPSNCAIMPIDGNTALLAIPQFVCLLKNDDRTFFSFAVTDSGMNEQDYCW
ncbi:MAG: hypothetical protein IJV49_01470 [Aeriscardovia sp.]|nr:hypothetical protein [Aeriscardovia sp.]